MFLSFFSFALLASLRVAEGEEGEACRLLCLAPNIFAEGVLSRKTRERSPEVKKRDTVRENHKKHVLCYHIRLHAVRRVACTEGA
jgi:hypothetical protein